MLRMTRKWSWDINTSKSTNVKRFILTHPAAVDPLTDQHTIDLWAAAYQWQKDKETIIIQDNVHENIFYVKAKQAKQLTDQDAENYKNLYNYINDNECDWNKGFEALINWRRYVRTFFSTWRVDISQYGSNCSCPTFHTKYMCKHVIGVVIRIGREKCPQEAKTRDLSKKR